MPLPIGTSLPSLDGATEWLDGPVAINALQGRPTLVQFWAVSCPICKFNMPSLLSFLETYCHEGLQILSIHMPRMDADMDVEKVRTVADELALTGPCAIDNAHTVGDLFQTGGVWPCYFLFDAGGKLRSRAAGQLGLKMAENPLKRFGMTSAMAAFALFSVDDLARMVGKAMQQRAGDNRIAGQLAKEFQQAGIALADLPPSYYQIGINCKYNHNSYGGNASSCSDCVTAGCATYYGSGSVDTNCNYYAGKYCG